MEQEMCENTVIHEDTVKNVKERMPDDELIYDGKAKGLDYNERVY